jgi:hypothetical protein
VREVHDATLLQLVQRNGDVQLCVRRNGEVGIINHRDLVASITVAERLAVNIVSQPDTGTSHAGEIRSGENVGEG